MQVTLLSNKKMRIKSLIIYVVVCLLVAAGMVLAEDDAILGYYADRAGSVFQSRNPIESGQAFSFRLVAYYRELNKQSEYELVDSAETRYFVSFGQVDSTEVIYKAKKELESFEINYPNIFKDDYIYNFYPNDSGGSELSIGFDSSPVDSTLPIGMVVIDRTNYYLRYLYLYYLADKKYKEQSFGYRFSEHDTFVYPDSVWIMKSERNFFSTTYFKYEYGIYDFKLIK